MDFLPTSKHQRRSALRSYALAAGSIVICLLLARACSGQCAGGVCYGPPSGFALSGNAAPDSVYVQAQASAAMCRVTSDTSTGQSIGSGALVATAPPLGYVLTCGHLFDDGANRISVVFSGGQRFEADVVTIDRPNDVALLRIAMPSIEPLRIGDGVQAGAMLTCCGFGGTGQLRAVRGPVVGYATALGATNASLRIRGRVRSGDSGGPVLDAAGRLVGVVWGVRNGVTYAAFGDPVRRLLRRVNQRVASRPTTPVAPATPSPDLPPDSVSRLAAIESRLNKITPCRCPENVVTRSDLAKLAKRSDLAGFAREAEVDAAFQSLRTSADQQSSRFAGLREQVLDNAKSVAVEAVRERLDGIDLKAFAFSKTQVVLASLGVGGPIGLALLAGRLWLRSRRRGRRVASRGQGGPRRGPFHRR